MYIVNQMMETALSLFKTGKDYFSVLHIAGACEEILGKYLKLRGIKTSLELDAEAVSSINKTLSGTDTTIKAAVIELNTPKNSIKHMNDSNDTTVIMDPKEEAEEMLNRAIINWLKLGKGYTSSMEEFMISWEQKYVKNNF